MGLFAASNAKPFLIGSALTGASLPFDGPTHGSTGTRSEALAMSRVGLSFQDLLGLGQ